MATLSKLKMEHFFFFFIYDFIVIQINTLQCALFSLIHRPKLYHELALNKDHNRYFAVLDAFMFTYL